MTETRIVSLAGLRERIAPTSRAPRSLAVHRDVRDAEPLRLEEPGTWFMIAGCSTCDVTMCFPAFPGRYATPSPQGCRPRSRSS